MSTMALLLAALLLQAGCADLIIRDHDDAGTVTSKVLARTLACLSTICISERQIYLAKEREQRQEETQQLVDNWNNAINRLSYDEALQRFGPPSSIAEGRDVFVAVWQSAPGPALLIPGPSLGFGPTYLAAQAPGHRLELTFDRERKVLRRWRMW